MSEQKFLKDEENNQALDINDLRERLSQKNGKAYWRGLEEIAETPEFKEYYEREFARGTAPWNAEIDRRSFLKVMAASLAMAGLGACRPQLAEKIIPYVKAPEEIVPGKPLYYATAVTFGGYATGVLAECYEGRPTKIEGNPDHPASLGATDAFTQATLLGLYDPDRSQAIVNDGRIVSWDEFLQAIRLEMQRQQVIRGRTLRILTETVTSPTLANQIRTLLRQYPEAKWHCYEPVNRDNVRLGAKQAFGKVVDAVYRFDRADVVLSLDSDFLFCGPGTVRYTGDFTDKRRVRSEQKKMNRLYVVESTPTLTGAMADHRLSMKGGDIRDFAMALARRLGVNLVGGDESSFGEKERKWIEALAKDLENNRGRSIVIVGDNQPSHVHALAHAINDVLGNNGSTVEFIEPAEANPVNHMESLQELVSDMKNDLVEVLIILGGNPVYSAPVDLEFSKHLESVRLPIHVSVYEDETSEKCKWHIPLTHEFEAWSDARAYDGSISIIQPLIQPLFSGRSAHEVLSALLDEKPRNSLDIVREYWEKQTPTAKEDFEKTWRRWLHDGIIPETKSPIQKVSLVSNWQKAFETLPIKEKKGFEIQFRPDSTIWDGRFANNPWLQELPKPITKITWDNVLFMSPKTAEKLGIKYHPSGWGQGTIVPLVELRYRGRSLKNIPVWIMPGQPEDTLTVSLGYGRTRGGRVAAKVGFDTYKLRTTTAPWIDEGAEVIPTSLRYPIATTQYHYSIEGRHLVRPGTLEEFIQNPAFAKEVDEHVEDVSLYPEREYKDYAWGMVIDTTVCTGCNACVIACQSENNIPSVGKTEVLRGREMHWIRIDRYYEGKDLDEPQFIYNQPVPCMHCERAPCEVVCPVAATVHSGEGLNEQIYNRCVGTRYCSNNCPYKVRRFNFKQYTDNHTPILKLMQNPNVSVRGRGVMEKCTYCVQRINAARKTAKKENRRIQDGEVVTACQQACPAGAIIFGDINDSKSRIARLKKEPHNYSMLRELNTIPRTTYLAKLRNPNPELEEA
ncbi:MAG TPA: TAT-variant-translocated molybdopterin oxidoreductase [Fimbriimonadales bacterium]|nr:TAT-variant-translocated molybdopterin oxidoreductase [Fimbriimonadales bacterium]